MVKDALKIKQNPTAKTNPKYNFDFFAHIPLLILNSLI